MVVVWWWVAGCKGWRLRETNCGVRKRESACVCLLLSLLPLPLSRLTPPASLPATGSHLARLT